MNCKCGHSMSIHDEGGCQHSDRTKGGIDLVCRCSLSPDAIAESKLSIMIEFLTEVTYKPYTDSDALSLLESLRTRASVILKEQISKPIPYEVYKDFEQGRPFKDE